MDLAAALAEAERVEAHRPVAGRVASAVSEVGRGAVRLKAAARLEAAEAALAAGAQAEDK